MSADSMYSRLSRSLVGLSFVVALLIGSGGMLATQSSSTVPTTSENLLEGNVTATSAAVTTTTANATTTKKSVAAAQNAADSDSRKVWAIVAGLVLVAVLLSVLTYTYWRHTSPAHQQS